jgi:hypothetical protein
MNPRDRMAYKGRASPRRSGRRSCATAMRPTAFAREEHGNSGMPLPATSNSNSDPATATAPMQVLRGIAVSPGIAIGPVLLGAAQPVHILTPSATVRRIINMTALTVADANAAR